MRILRLIIGGSCALFGNLLLVGAASTIGNHLGRDPNKISAEWKTTLWVAGFQAAVGLIPAVFGAFALHGVARTATLSGATIALAAAWVFVCLLAARMNAGYLWLLVGLPLIVGYFVVRSVQHLRARAA